MKTCRQCLSQGIPDAATHCKHCGKRLQPRLSENDWKGIIIVLLLLIIASVGLYYARQEEEHDAARSQARIEIESLKAVHCTPDIAEEFDEVNTRKFEEELDRSPLDLEEKESLKAAFANGMQLAGCGFNARNQAKPAPKRR